MALTLRAVVHRMIGRYSGGYDIIYGQCLKRQGDSAFKRRSAWLFYWLMRAERSFTTAICGSPTITV